MELAGMRIQPPGIYKQRQLFCRLPELQGIASQNGRALIHVPVY